MIACSIVTTADRRQPGRLSNRLKAGRGRRRFSTVNCRRSPKFSEMRSRRLWKIRRSDPNASQSTPGIIVVIIEFWQRAAGYVINRY
jgi:hypothetical protein